MHSCWSIILFCTMCLILFVFKFYLENALEKKMKKILTHPSFGRSPTLSAPSPPLSPRSSATGPRPRPRAPSSFPFAATDHRGPRISLPPSLSPVAVIWDPHVSRLHPFPRTITEQDTPRKQQTPILPGFHGLSAPIKLQSRPMVTFPHPSVFF